MTFEETPPTRVEGAPPSRISGSFEPGTEVGGYRILEILGSGGMGQVYRAVDADDRQVAMKILHPHLSRDEEARERLRREVSALHRVRGDRVARVLDAEVDGFDAFIVTELLSGLTLDQSVREEGVFEGEELVELAQELSQALNAIHGADVVHRDLKPSNVMLTEQGAKVIDFGIAQVGDETRITQTGLVVGTAGYLAPEVFSGAPPTTERIDWYAWAAVLLYAATGKQPFGTGPFQAVLARMERAEPLVEGLAPGVAAGLRAALHPDPRARAHPAAVIRQLQHPDVALDEITQINPVSPAPSAAPTMVAVPYQPTQMLPGTPTGTVDPTQWQPHEIAPPPAHPPIPSAGSAVMASFLLLFAMLGAGAVLWALLGLVVALVLARTTGIARVGQFRRRMRRGSQKAGAVGLVVRLPWYLLRGIGGLILPVLLSLFCGALIFGLAWLATWISSEVASPDTAESAQRVILACAGALATCAAALIMWRWDTVPITGRSGQPLDYDGATRVGARAIIAGIARSKAARALIALIVILASLLLLLITVAQGWSFNLFELLHIPIPGA
ncbi:MAG TPA: serine/threonine-protein kinase [Actinomycetales bacterium]|nr:serine/threonine-protein kinase [Actinomycetales bacterium]